MSCWTARCCRLAARAAEAAAAGAGARARGALPPPTSRLPILSPPHRRSRSTSSRSLRGRRCGCWRRPRRYGSRSSLRCAPAAARPPGGSRRSRRGPCRRTCSRSPCRRRVRRPVLGVVLPGARAAPVAADVRVPVDVGVPVVVVVDVDVDVVVAPAAVAPGAAPGRADHHPHGEPHESRARGVGRVVDGRVRIDRGAVDVGRAVGGDVDRVRVRRSMTMTCFVSMTLVSTFCCSLEARALLSFAFLRIRWTASMTSLCCARKALPEVRRPLDVLGKPLDGVREGRHRLDGGVPALWPRHPRGPCP